MARTSDLSLQDNVSHATWQEFVRASERTLPFHRAEWLQVLEAHQADSLRRIGITDSAVSGKMIGVMPLLVRRFGLFRVGASPIVVEDTPYLGPVVPPDRLVDALIQVRDHFKREVAFLRTILPFAVSVEDRERLKTEGFDIMDKHTHVLDLSVGESVVWDEMKGSCRTSVRKARKSGVETTHIFGADVDVIDSYYPMVQHVYESQGMPTPNPRDFYRSLWRAAAPAGLVSLILARMEGTVIAGALLAHDDERVYYIDGASLREYRKARAMNLVLWDGIRWAASTGRQQFDFVGSDIPRLAQFKAAFGGTLTEHSCIEWSRGKTVRAIRDWYGRFGKQILAKLADVVRR